MEEKNLKTKKRKIIRGILKVLLVLVLLGIVIAILKIAPNYKNTDITGKTNVVINNNNITAHLKNDVYIENENIYMSKPDLENFFDPDIYYEENYNQIITTYETNIANLYIGENKMKLNDQEVEINGEVTLKDEIYYIPISDLTSVYNIDIGYIKESDTVVIESIDREKITAKATKNTNVKSMKKVLCRTVDKIKENDEFVIIEKNAGWVEVRTTNGKIGYIKENIIKEETKVREAVEQKTNTQKISLVWDYYSEYVNAPDRSGETFNGVNVVSPSFFVLERLGKGEIIDNVGTAGIEYINWAKEKGYKIWAMFSNNSMIETTSQIMRDYELREKTINNIVELAEKYELDGINLDFENMYKEDKNLYTRFVIELYPRLKARGMTLSVDVTAPDGGDTWSLCFDRHNIARNSDYIVFMAYDQHGQSSTTAGSVAAYNWVEVNLNKFLGTQEEIEKEKLILGIPFYTRLWRETGEDVTSSVVDMKDVNNVLPGDIQREWLDDVKQNYIEYERNGSIYKMWIEDIDSIRAKINLAREKEIAGVAFWAKGREDESVWDVVEEYISEN
mgnify:CR=1 FL=1